MPKSWEQKNPEAFNRLKTLKSLISLQSQELNIPIENLCSPDLVRKWCWLMPTTEVEITSQWFLDQGARPWQAQIMGVLSQKVLDNPGVDEFPNMA